MNRKSTRLKMRTGCAPAVALALVAALTLGSVTAVAAADDAGPGDLLYPIDIAAENLRLDLAGSPEAEVELRAGFAAERIAEVQRLLQDGGLEAGELAVALAGLAAQKAAVADLVSQEEELKALAESLDDLFDQAEQELEASFRESRRAMRSRPRLSAAAYVGARNTCCTSPFSLACINRGSFARMLRILWTWQRCR